MKSMTTDPIADLLTRLRNAELVSHSECVIPYSTIKESILNILKKHSYIKGFSVKGEGVDKRLEASLIENSVKTTYIRVSKPGQRIYKQSSEIRSVQSGLGIAIYSTSKGLMDNIEARRSNVGGEILCEVW